MNYPSVTSGEGTSLRPLYVLYVCLDVSQLPHLIDKFSSWPWFFWECNCHNTSGKRYLGSPQLSCRSTMSGGPIRNVPKRRHAQTPFYPSIEAQPGPSTSRLRGFPAHAHGVNKAAGQAVSVIDLTTTDDEVASQTSVDIHRKPTVRRLNFLMPEISSTVITHSWQSLLKMWPKSPLTTKLLSKPVTPW